MVSWFVVICNRIVLATQTHGSKMIRQWVNWYTIQRMIHKITPSVNYNKWLKRLDIQLIEPNKTNFNNSPQSCYVIIKLWGLE